MKPVLAVVLGTLVVTAGSGSGAAAGRFDVAMPPARQAAHVLNRAAFGPRAADLAEIRRIGVERWLRQQLDPASIPDSRELTAKLASLESQKLATWQIFENYQPAVPLIRPMTMNMAQLLPGDQMRRLLNGTADEKKASSQP